MFHLIIPIIHLCYVSDQSIPTSVDEADHSNSNQPSTRETEKLDSGNALNDADMADEISPLLMNRRSQFCQADGSLSNALNLRSETDSGVHRESRSRFLEITGLELAEVAIQFYSLISINFT